MSQHAIKRREEEAQQRIRELEEKNQKQVSGVSPHMYSACVVCVDGYCSFHTLTAGRRGAAPLGGEEGGGGDDHREAWQGILGTNECG